MHIDLQTLKDHLVGYPDSDSGKMWRNGRAFYSQGMVTDVYQLGEVLAGNMLHHSWTLSLLLLGQGGHLNTVRADRLVDSQQMYLTWQPVHDAHVHREVTALENTRLALELSLKAVLTQSGTQYENTHDLLYLWGLLENTNRQLVHEIRAESQSFYHSYINFVRQLQSLKNQLQDALDTLHTNKDITEIRQISKNIDALTLSSPYSYLPNVNFPKCDQWLNSSLVALKDWEDQGIRLWTYLRYGDALEDKLPIEFIAHIHMMARFMYEHLVPIPRQLEKYENKQYRLWTKSLEKIWDRKFGNSSK